MCVTPIPLQRKDLKGQQGRHGKSVTTGQCGACHQVLRTEKEAPASALTLKEEDRVKASQTCTHASQGRRISWSAQDEEEECGSEERARQGKQGTHTLGTMEVLGREAAARGWLSSGNRPGEECESRRMEKGQGCTRAAER